MNHSSESFEPDDDGWFAAICSCRRFAVMGLPDSATAVDVLMEHAYAEGHRDGMRSR